MNNGLSKLNSVLFLQLKKLETLDITTDELKKEVMRAKAITNVASKIIDTAELALDMYKTTGGNIPANSKFVKGMIES